MSNKRSRKHLTAEEKADFILLCLRSNHSVTRCCREHEVPVSAYYKWLKAFISDGTNALQRKVKPRKLEINEVIESRATEFSILRARHFEFLFRESNNSGNFSTKEKMHILKLASASRLSQKQFTKCIEISRSSFNNWKKCLRSYGNIRPPLVGQPYVKMAERDEVKRKIFKVLHAPPAKYGFHRRTWVYPELQKAIQSENLEIGQHNIRKVIRDAGYRWLRAEKVLTSNDPDYREKLDNIHNILQGLKPKEGFFSIDEYGPFAIKHRQGKKLVPPGETITVKQWQKYRGCLIMTAALEISTNQVTHFYSAKKDTEEMIKLLDILLLQYREFDRIYLSWDAASWHISKKLFEDIDEINVQAKSMGSPFVKVAPLPAGAQFLNVIESVFSGMARAVIHNSDYRSIDEAKNAIDTHFKLRNSYFKNNPKKAGNKIWGMERTPSHFSESHNCKDPAYR